MKPHVVIAGAGQAAIQLAHSLREKQFDGDITPVGAEAYPAYQRPPLSKGFLKGEVDEERLYLKPESFYETAEVRLLKGVRVTAIDRDNSQVTTSQGEHISYTHLVLATGTTPRMLPELEGVSGVMVMRSIEDAIQLRERIANVKHVTVLGGGYIGLEAAAVMRQLGIEVTVLEMMPRLLARVTSDAVSAYFAGLHQEHGVDVRSDTKVSSFVIKEDTLVGVALESGETLSTDLLLVGIGVTPNVELAEAASLDCDNGILVDADARSSAENIYAIGDCSRRPLKGQADKLRLESVPSALDTAEIAACHIAGKERPGFEPPWFWSDQYDTKIQTVGLFSDHDETLVRGDVSAGQFSVFYFQSGQCIAVDAVNDPKTFMACKNLMKAERVMTAADLADADEPIMDIYKRLK